MIVYLCGPINGCTDEECSDWRTFAAAELSEFQMLDPMRRDYRGREDVAWREIVDGDKADIDAADVLLVNHPKPSVGTSMEVFLGWQLHKPVIVVAPLGASVSPWMRYHATQIVNSFEDAFSLIRGYER